MIEDSHVFFYIGILVLGRKRVCFGRDVELRHFSSNWFSRELFFFHELPTYLILVTYVCVFECLFNIG